MIKFALNDNKKINVNWQKLEKVVSSEFKKSGTISVAAISNQAIKKINSEYRKKDQSTDILTFVFGKSDDYLGEILLNPDDIKKRAQKSGKSFVETAAYLVAHGVCHIFGFTHQGRKDTKKMETKEKKMMQKLWN